MNLDETMIAVREAVRGIRVSDDSVLLASAILILADRLRQMAEELPADD